MDTTGSEPPSTAVAAPAAGATAAETVAEPVGAPGRTGERLVSLDVFRGATIAGMLLVNNPGTWAHIYPPLRHAEWHGWTPTDLIFPFFLFIVGVAMTFSFGKRMERGADRRALFAKVVRRSVVLFMLGLLLHAFPWWDVDLATLRIPGVLQRIALAYLAGSAVVLTTGVRGQAGIAGLLLLVYWALLSWVPVPGVGAGVLEPGRDLGAYIDRMVFGTNHLWAYSETWDPEGLLSTIPAIGTVLFGVLAGHWIRGDRDARDTTVGLFLAGSLGLVLGLAWDAVFPINKNLWTSSYTVFTAGMALHALAVCYWFVDVRRRRRWARPFIIFGTNAIAAYVLSGIGARILNLIRVGGEGADAVTLKAFLYENVFASWLSPVNASLAFALTYVLFWLGVMTVFYRKGIFLKV